MSSGKGSGSEIFKYFMSLHMGVCAGPIDEVKSIIMGDRAVWEGSITQSQTFNVDLPDLFGGGTKEGGVKGGITVLMGEDHQFLPLFLLEKFGEIADRIPSYRNMTSIFFHESVQVEYDGSLIADLYDVGQDGLFDNVETQNNPAPFVGSGGWPLLLAQSLAATSVTRRGFYFQANNPYLRKLKIIGTRTAKGLDRRYGTIWRDAAETVADANPAHVIYELQKNKDFGAGMPMGQINVESYELAAKTLWEEGFGVSLKWIQQGKVKDIILEMLDHINAVCYEDPRTGLSTLKLLRGDYDVDALPLADGTNSVVTSFQRKHEELVNEVVATYTDGQSYEEATVSVQDLAGIASEGGVISTGRNYYAVMKPELATALAERDLRAEGYPLATAEVEFFREFWDLNPGDVVKVDSPEDSDDVVVMRVLALSDEIAGTGAVKGSLVEDVFALEAAPLQTGPASIFVDSDRPPDPAETIQAMTLPYTFAARAGLGFATDEDYPVVRLGVLASSSQAGVDSFQLAGEQVGALGSSQFEVLGANTIISRGTLAEPLVAEVETVTIPLEALTNGELPEPESVLVIGGGSEETQELAGVTATTDTTVTLRRGILDTNPKPWVVGTPVWVLGTNSTFWDASDRAAFEGAEYKVLPVSAIGTLPIDDAALQTFTLGERPYLPFRPANVTVGGVAFGVLDLAVQGDVLVTWKNRQRQSEDAAILAWDADSVIPETGQTTVIEVLNSAGVVVATHGGLSGETFSVPATSFDGLAEATVRVSSVRDTFRSFQAHEISVNLPGGYGQNYGKSYGG